jgi:endoglucanase
MGMTMVTGFGARSPQHPHRRPSVARGGAPLPGFLLGDTNPGQQDRQGCVDFS